MNANQKEAADLVVSFITKEPQYAIPSVPVNVDGKSTTEEFDNIVKAFLNEHKNDHSLTHLNEIEFDFLINNKLLRNTIKEFVDKEKISGEEQLEVEYFTKTKPPEPHNSFLHDDWVSSVDTMDDWILSGCYDNTAHIWDVQSGKHKIAIPAHNAPIKAVKWISFGQADETYHFVTCSHDETCMIWKWNNKLNKHVEHIFTFIGHSRSVDCVDVKNDLVLTGSYDRMLKVWSLVENEQPKVSESKQKDANSNKSNKLRSPVITIEGHKEAITGCSWLSSTESDISTAATVSLDNSIKIWDIELGEQKQTLTSNKPLMDIDYSKTTALLLTSSCDRHIRLWDSRQNEGAQIRSVYSSHSGWVSSVAWSKTNPNLFVSGSYDSSVKEWDIRSPSAPLYDMLGHHEKVLAVNWSNKDFIVSGASDNQIKIFANK